MTNTIQDVYVVAAVRTPVGKARGAFAHTRPDDMLAHVLKETLAKAPSIDPTAIDDVIVGCAMPEGEQGMNVARIGVLLADLPDTVPAVTVNRFCSSGVQTVSMAADRIALGKADVMIAGGTESMTMIPMGGHAYRANPEFFTDNEKHVAIAYGMGITAENVAKQWKVTREEQDAFAFESHQRALKAIESGAFKDEIVPYTVRRHVPNFAAKNVDEKTFVFENDEGPRADSTLEKLAKLRTVFDAKGTVTAGNSSQMSDGAGALILVSEKALKQFNLTPIARFVDFDVAGVPPEIMGIGPKDAIPKVLKRAGLSIDDMDWIELNEAFAAQSLAVIKDLGLDPAKVNPNGGAIALGHPLGATGAIRAATAIHGCRLNKLKYGMVTMCIGTGMGAAGVFEIL